MVTKIRGKAAGRKRHLYIAEWMEHRGLSDETLANRLETDRTTIWRWRTQQHRLNPPKIAALASVLDIEPFQLWGPPGVESLDAMVMNAPAGVRDTAVEIIGSLLKRSG